MGDRLTQLQECFDQLATQMFASLRYINTHHAASPIPGQQFDRHFPSVTNPKSSTVAGNATTTAPNTPAPPASAPAPATPSAPAADNDNSNNAANNNNDSSDPDQPPRPDTPNTFAAALRELSRDLVLKEQQIEMLIASLPGIGQSREEQEGRLRGLEGELRAVEEEVRGWEKVKEELIEQVEGTIAKIWRP